MGVYLPIVWHFKGRIGKAMRNKSTGLVYELVKKDRNVIAVTADNGNEIYEKIRIERPDQYIDYGIAECNMVASAAGLADKGKIPFLYAVTNFMSMRAYEFIRNVVCVTGSNVKFIGRSSSMVTGTYGMTHQGTEDLALLRTLPNLITVTPATPIEAREATRFAYHHRGPVYIRVEAANEPELHDSDDYVFEPGKSHVFREGTDLSVICMGSVINEALAAADRAADDGLSVEVINMPTVKPIDRQIIDRIIHKRKAIITLEEHSVYGGLGSSVAEIIADKGNSIRFDMMGLLSYPRGCGNRFEMRKLNGLDADSVYDRIRKVCY